MSFISPSTSAPSNSSKFSPFQPSPAPLRFLIPSSQFSISIINPLLSLPPLLYFPNVPSLFSSTPASRQAQTLTHETSNVLSTAPAQERKYDRFYVLVGCIFAFWAFFGWEEKGGGRDERKEERTKGREEGKVVGVEGWD